MRRPASCSLLALLTFLACTSASPDEHPSAGAGSGGTAPTAGAAGTNAGAAPSAGTAGSGGGSSGGLQGLGGGATSGTAGAYTGGAAAGNPSGGAAGATGGGSGGAAASCVTQGSELCDDFEGDALDARWTLIKNPGSVAITLDGQHVHGGQRAVHLKLEAGQQSTAMLSETATFPATNNSFYARAYFYFTPDLPTAPGGDFHMGFVLGMGKNDAGDVQAGAGMIGGDRQYLGYSIFFGPPKYEFGPWSKARVMPNVWQCVELFEDGSSPDEEKRQVWLDGFELTDLRSTSANQGAPTNHKPPAFASATFGVWEYHPSPLLSDIWIDDVRVSSKPIGCN
jgi:hypothetical protein